MNILFSLTWNLQDICNGPSSEYPEQLSNNGWFLRAVTSGGERAVKPKLRLSFQEPPEKKKIQIKFLSNLNIITQSNVGIGSLDEQKWPYKRSKIMYMEIWKQGNLVVILSMENSPILFTSNFWKQNWNQTLNAAAN